MLDKADFRARNVNKAVQEDSNPVCAYKRVSKYMKIKLIELKRDRIKATFIARDFSTLNLATKQQHSN